MAIKKQQTKKKEMTLDRLALMMGKGFNEVHDKMDKGFASVDRRFEQVDRRFEDVSAELKGDIAEVRTELKGDIAEVKADVNILKNGIEKFIMFYERQEQEFTIMKDEMRRIKIILEEKLGVKI